MSESVPASHPVAEAPHFAEVAHSVAVAVPFDERQIEQFDADDGDAGRALGKMLALFFCYTVLATSAVAFWTMTRPKNLPTAPSAVEAESGESAPSSHE